MIPDNAASSRAFVPVFSAFAGAYLLSYLFRNANAVVSPELTRELGLSSASLGFLTSAYFLAFCLVQLPVGVLLDRYGPRRVEPVLLAFAALGAATFAFADAELGLTLGRALIGIGVSACLMAPLKAIAMWYPPERQASLGSWMMVAGGIGAIAATAPLEFALHFMSWRVVFLVLAGATLAVAIAIAWRVPDIEKPRIAADLASQLAGLRAVLVHQRVWWIVPLGAFGMGAVFAIQGLWAMPWMLEVQGVSRATAASQLLAMSIASLLGYLFLGVFATTLDRRGIRGRHLYAAGFTLNALALLLIALKVPGAIYWWSLYGLGAASNILAFAVLNEGFSPELAGRTNTAVNLVMFAGGFALQWGVGLLVAFARAWAGVDASAALQGAFFLILIFYVASLAWFFAGWRKYASTTRQ